MSRLLRRQLRRTVLAELPGAAGLPEGAGFRRPDREGGVQAGHPRGRAGGAGQVSIRGLHEDGWLGQRDGAVLVRVEGAAAEILVTVYQSHRHPAEAAPRLQVVPITNTGPQREPLRRGHE